MENKLNHLLKLKLNKTTIAKLNEQEMHRINGGYLNHIFANTFLSKIEAGDTNCTGNPTNEFTKDCTKIK